MVKSDSKINISLTVTFFIENVSKQKAIQAERKMDWIG